jgi:alcohol dehydrogenase/propanol-preferring alcohol dehydrogenase
VGWHGGHDGTCERCLAGDFILCENARITGIAFDGGYADFMVAPAVARVPQGMDFVEAAPLLCAGITTFNSLRNSGARTADLVAIQGLGGLGHLGVQFAKAMGFEVAAVSRGSNKEEFARKLGAHHYVDASDGDVGQKLQKLGGGRVIPATAPNSKSISELVAGLDNNGTLLVVAAPFGPISVSPLALISGRRRIQGWPSGTAVDSTETLRFAQLHGIRPMVEAFPLTEATTAYDKMMKGEVRFRSVLDLAN